MFQIYEFWRILMAQIPKRNAIFLKIYKLDNYEFNRLS